MKSEIFVWRSRIEAPSEEVFDWHARSGAFQRLTPPWETVQIIRNSGGIKDGDQLVMKVSTPFPIQWVAEHRNYIHGKQFCDFQVSGPFAKWEHMHLVEPDGVSACYLEDRIEYALPMGRMGEAMAGKSIQKKLNRMFDYRHEITKRDIMQHQQHKGEKMKIAITGSTGLVGSALIPFLTAGGHEVKRLVRSETRGLSITGPASQLVNEVHWNPLTGNIDKENLEGIDAIVHLAGEPIASGRWNARKKKRILDSRIEGTKLISQTITNLQVPPKVLLSASAIGFYGDRGDEILNEDSQPGSGFLSEVCEAWEKETESAKKNIRVVNLRFGVVLTPAGGALARMLLPFRLGIAGNLSVLGRQYMSWIGLDDVIGVIHHVLTNEGLSGPVNVVSPRPVRNSEYTKTLNKVLGRPFPMNRFPIPSFGVRALLGEMADALLLSSAKIEPSCLVQTGYDFRHPELESSLRFMMGR